jgi:MFS family permease
VPIWVRHLEGTNILIAGSDRPERRATRLVFLLCGMAQSAWAPLVPYAKARVHANDQQFGLLLLCFGAGSILSMPTMGSLASRHGCKRLTQIAACSIFVGLVACRSEVVTDKGAFHKFISIAALHTATSISRVH